MAVRTAANLPLSAPSQAGFPESASHAASAATATAAAAPIVHNSNGIKAKAWAGGVPSTVLRPLVVRK